MGKTAKVLVFRDKPAVTNLNFVEPGTLGGTVRHRSTGKPIEGWTVRLWGNDWKLAGTVQTDSEGAYRFEGVPRGAYVVSLDVQAGHTAEQEESPVRMGQTGIAEVDFLVDSADNVQGRVVDEDLGTPLSGVDVDLYDSDGHRVARGKTTETGDYQFRGLVADSYTVRVSDAE